MAISACVSALLLLATSAAISSGLRSVEVAEDLTDAGLFLETVSEDLALLSYDELLAMNGNRVFDDELAADSRYAIDLTVFETALDLLQVQCVLVDLRSTRDVARYATLRSKR